MTTRDASTAALLSSFTFVLCLGLGCATSSSRPASMRFDPYKRDQVFDRAVKKLSREAYPVAERDRGAGKIATAPTTTRTQESCGLGVCEMKKIAIVTLSPSGEAVLEIKAWFRPSVRTTPEDDMWKPAWTSSQQALVESEAQALLGAMAPDAPEMSALK